MDAKKVGNQIAQLRKLKGLTQTELGERLTISFQAVSKWERGETLPDTAILPDLARVLETTVDFILLGGERLVDYKGKVSVSDLIQGLKCLEKMGDYLGNENIIYRAAINGINESLNTDVEKAFNDDYVFEAFVAEAVIQSLCMGAYIDITDVKNSFKYDHFKEIVLSYCSKKGIK